MRNLSLEEFLSREIDPAFKRRAKIIIDNLDLKDGDKILEVGCGRGYYANIIATYFPKCSYIGIDINDDYLKVAKNLINQKNIRFEKCSAENMSFSDKSFNKVICTEVLEHVEDDKKVISEIYRVLKPKGIVLVTVPNKNYPFLWDPLNWILERLLNLHIPSNIWWLAGIWADHIRLYREDELLKKLKEHKFKKMAFWRSTKYCFPFSHFLLYGIGKNLVENGCLRDFNRFSNFEKKSSLLIFTIKVFDFFDRKNNDNFRKNDPCMNLIVKVTKV